MWPWLRRRLSAKRERENIETPPVSRVNEQKYELILGLLNESSRNVGLEVKFNDIGLCINSSGKQILSRISGAAQEGSILGIMGPSGSGKCE
jgi:ABC-type multidrug transport system ATPase subunit